MRRVSSILLQDDDVEVSFHYLVGEGDDTDHVEIDRMDHDGVAGFHAGQSQFDDFAAFGLELFMFGLEDLSGLFLHHFRIGSEKRLDLRFKLFDQMDQRDDFRPCVLDGVCEFQVLVAELFGRALQFLYGGDQSAQGQQGGTGRSGGFFMLPDQTAQDFLILFVHNTIQR